MQELLHRCWGACTGTGGACRGAGDVAWVLGSLPGALQGCWGACMGCWNHCISAWVLGGLYGVLGTLVLRYVHGCHNHCRGAWGPAGYTGGLAGVLEPLLWVLGRYRGYWGAYWGWWGACRGSEAIAWVLRASRGCWRDCGVLEQPSPGPGVPWGAAGCRWDGVGAVGGDIGAGNGVRLVGAPRGASCDGGSWGVPDSMQPPPWPRPTGVPTGHPFPTSSGPRHPHPAPRGTAPRWIRPQGLGTRGTSEAGASSPGAGHPPQFGTLGVLHPPRAVGGR